MRRIIASAAVITLAVVGVASAQTADPKDAHIQAAIDELQAALAIPPTTVTVPTTVVLTETATVTVVPTSTTVVATPTTTPPPVTVLQGSCPFTFTWDQAHGGCPSARTTTGSGLLTFADIREDDWEDGWKPREQPAWSGAATIAVRNVYATRIRDDSIENDNFISGTIADSLFDGVHTFLSEQCEGSGTCTTTTISPGEDPNVYIDHVLVRLEDPNADDREGMWFKWQGRGKPEHHPVITDSVFAISEQPNAGWSTGASFKGAEFHGTNFVLWLGTGTYGGAKPAGVTFLEGQTARDKWCAVRSAWLSAHGYAVTACDTAP